VSTGRTGTRYLAEFLTEHYPQVEAHHTTPRSTLFNVLSNMHLAGMLSERALLRCWRTLKGREFALTKKSLFVDSNNHLYVFAALARQLYPQVKVIHIVRDPRTYIRSHLNWSRQRLKSFIANHVLPFWQPNGFLLNEVSAWRWLMYTRFEQFCWIWQFKNQYLTSIGDTETPYLRLRFEDLTRHSIDQNAMARLVDFLSLPATTTIRSAGPVNETRRRVFPAWQRWSPKMCAHLDRTCGEQMRLHGYGFEEEWSQKVRLGNDLYGVV